MQTWPAAAGPPTNWPDRSPTYATRSPCSGSTCSSSGASLPFKDALADPAPVVTRAFSGRPARAPRNALVDAHDAEAVAGYPAIRHLTSPMRRAAAAAGDPERINLWAGTGYRRATTTAAATILGGLAADL